MFIAIPHSAEFRWEKAPWLVITLMVVCTLIYIAQDRNEAKLDGVFQPYCKDLYKGESSGDASDWEAYFQLLQCEHYLTAMHERPDKKRYIDYLRHKYEIDSNDGALSERAQFISDLPEHYEKARVGLPESLYAKLMFEPLFYNPLRSLSSALSHASWWHLIGNMIFFFAFTPALEMVIGSRLRLLGAMVVISLVCDFAYFVSVQMLGAASLPSLGFSGVVMGMIGLSGYLLPNVKIRTFVWVLHFARNVYIPAWILAVWYIGWDAWYMVSSSGSSGVNFIAHVFGGATGYLLGRYWFSGLKKEIEHDVADEIEHHRAQRHDKFGILSSYRSSRPVLVDAMRERSAKRDFSDYVSKIHHAVEVGNDALAINLLLERYDEYRKAIALYEEIYEEMLQWEHTRAILCFSRLLITEYINLRQYAKAIEVARRALQMTPEFVFAEEGQRELLEAMAKRQGIVITAP